MSITQGLFSDVLANAPQAQGSADWSKTLPMAGAVDWANVRPFQVINPLTGYNYGATQPSSSSAQEDKPQLSEYQKWLAQQSETKTSGGSDGGGGAVRGYQGPYTDKDWADIKKIRDELGWGNEMDTANLKGFLGATGAFFTGNPLMGMKYAFDKANQADTAFRQYQEAMNSGLSLPNYRDIVNQMSVNGQGGFMAQPAPNTDMSLSDQYSQYGAGRIAAEALAAQPSAEVTLASNPELAAYQAAVERQNNGGRDPMGNFQSSPA